MTDFSKILDKAKELEAKMKESQEKIKNIRVEGVSGTNSVKVTLDGEGEMQKIELSDEILKEDKAILEDLIVAAHNNAKSKWFLCRYSTCYIGCKVESGTLTLYTSTVGVCNVRSLKDLYSLVCNGA